MTNKLLLPLVVVIIFSYTIFPNTNSADIYGTVFLPSGDPLIGVQVILTGDTIGKKITKTSIEGNFRFLQLPPGNYSIKLRLRGFNNLVREGIRLFIGKDVKLTFQMETATIKNELSFKARTGIVDTRKTIVGVNISKESIQSLPTARNPWTIINLIPGIMIDREDVGGNESGQQSQFYGHGSSTNNTTWNINGSEITDPAVDGAASFYLDINACEEFQVTLGANDITAQTGGVQLNFVSKRSGNLFSGDFHLYVEDDNWQMVQNIPESITAKGWGSPGIYRLYQYGVGFGGPIKRDKIWFFGSWSVQDIHTRTITNNEDSSWLISGFGTLSFQSFNTSADLHIMYNNKTKLGRTAIGAANQGTDTLWDQDGSGYLYTGSFQQIFDNLMLNVKFIYNDNGFTLDPKGSSIDDEGHNTGNDWLYYYSPTRYDDGSRQHYFSTRDSFNLSLDGNYFTEKFLGGEHEIRFGFHYYQAAVSSTSLYPNQRVALIQQMDDPGFYQELWLIPDAINDRSYNRYSFYCSDTATFGKLSLNLGIRYDWEKSKLQGGQQPGFSWYEPGSSFHGTSPPEVAEFLGDLTVPEMDVPISWSSLSPRLSVSYDIHGNGKNVLKLSLARYGSKSGNFLADSLFPYREIDVRWYDSNGDLVPNYTEVDFSDWTWWNTDNIDYERGISKNKFDPGFSSPLLDEVTVSFEKELGENLGISVTGFYKRQHNLFGSRGVMADGSIEAKDNWYQVGNFTHSNGNVVPYFGRYEKPLGEYHYNLDRAYNRYLALQFSITKKFSPKWMFDGSFIYMNWKRYIFEAETIDLNNFDYFNEGVMAPMSKGSGLSDIYGNSRWQLKFSGLYKFRHGINLTWVFQARDGYIIPYYSWLYISQGNVGWTKLYEGGKKFGDDRLPAFWMMNLGLEKTFWVSTTMNVTLLINIYNVTNNSITLKVNPVIGDTQDEIERILNPGIYQLGFRVNF